MTARLPLPPVHGILVTWDRSAIDETALKDFLGAAFLDTASAAPVTPTSMPMTLTAMLVERKRIEITLGLEKLIEAVRADTIARTAPPTPLTIAEEDRVLEAAYNVSKLKVEGTSASLEYAMRELHHAAFALPIKRAAVQEDTNVVA